MTGVKKLNACALRNPKSLLVPVGLNTPADRFERGDHALDSLDILHVARLPPERNDAKIRLGLDVTIAINCGL